MKDEVCCARFLKARKKSRGYKKSCKDCPLMSGLPKKQRRKLLKTLRGS
jgi:hypothetical protein